jgi:Cof subfamily protein (haloacid dehalogenase superfamily)
MLYKLIACDVDGTLLDSSFTATNIDKDAIARAQDKGIIFSLCSGRSYKSLKTIAQDLGVRSKGNYIVGFNGGVVYDFENLCILKQDYLDKNAGIRAMEIFKEAARNIEIVVYVDAEHILYEKGAEYAPTYQETSKCDWQDVEDIIEAVRNLDTLAKVIFLGENSDLKRSDQELADKLGEKTCTLFTAEYMVEVTPTASTKAGGVKWLCQKHGIDISEVICIGDNYNDISMIKAAGLGVAVANAVDAAKEVADYVTKNDCANGAVAEVISKFVL